MAEKRAAWLKLPWRYWWAPALILTLALGAWGLWWHRPPPPPPPPPPEASSRMETLCLTEIQEGDKRWVLEGQRADFHNERDEVSVSGVQVEFFREGKESIKIRGEDGLLNTKTRVLTLRGNVEMESGDMVVKTSIIIYHPDERLLLGPEDLTLEGPRLKVQGKGLRLWLTDKKLELAQHQETELKGKGPTP